MDARLYQPAKTAMQSGQARTKTWILETEALQPLSIEPVMGWVSAHEAGRRQRLSFETQEQALAFARTKGWTVRLDAPQTASLRTKSYGDNFSAAKIRT